LPGRAIPPIAVEQHLDAAADCSSLTPQPPPLPYAVLHSRRLLLQQPSSSRHCCFQNTFSSAWIARRVTTKMTARNAPVLMMLVLMAAAAGCAMAQEATTDAPAAGVGAAPARSTCLHAVTTLAHH
jgi:hypothetical protein